MSLKHEILHCPNVRAWFNEPNKHNPCSRIVASKGLPRISDAVERFQPPEPWQGHIDRSRILFLSSNPSIDTDVTDPYPRWSTPEEELTAAYDSSFDRDGGWIRDGKYYRRSNGKWQAQPFFAAVKRRASEVLDKDAEPGIDYALTEVVHCKSLDAQGVPEAASPCARLWLRRVIGKSSARLIVVLGRKIPSVVKPELAIAQDVPTQWGLWGPGDVVGRQRYVAFLGHPGGPDPKTFSSCILDDRRLAQLKAFVTGVLHS